MDKVDFNHLFDCKYMRYLYLYANNINIESPK